MSMSAMPLGVLSGGSTCDKVVVVVAGVLPEVTVDHVSDSAAVFFGSPRQSLSASWIVL